MVKGKQLHFLLEQPKKLLAPRSKAMAKNKLFRFHLVKHSNNYRLNMNNRRRQNTVKLPLLPYTGELCRDIKPLFTVCTRNKKLKIHFHVLNEKIVWRKDFAVLL